MSTQEDLHHPTAEGTSAPHPSQDGLDLLKAAPAMKVVTWTSLLFAVLQSLCTFLAALGTVRLFIGAAALATISQVGTFWERFHVDAIRVPMIGLALAGVLLSLLSLLSVRRLRRRKSSQWRRRPLTPRQMRTERLQITVQVATLALLTIEEIMHFRQFHHL